MRRLTGFDCSGSWCAATLDEGEKATGLFVVSGGNEIRSGAHAGQAALAAHFAALGYPVFRYDRRGIGDSEGENGGFEDSAADIAAALAAFRALVPHVTRIVAFGNCDAASALALFHQGLGVDHMILANPWVIETPAAVDAPTPPPAAAVRARYWQRLKDPYSLWRLVSGQIDMRKLWAGLMRASRGDAPTGLAARMAQALATGTTPATIALARRDTTAQAFAAAWSDPLFDTVRKRSDMTTEMLDSASHSFASEADRHWLFAQIGRALADRG